MTFWYMSQVGRDVFTKKDMPKAWDYMTPEDAGYNAIKQALFFISYTLYFGASDAPCSQAIQYLWLWLPFGK